MTAELDVLLKAILAEPDDDLPRLVYADLLDESGDDNDAARAEFIRLQIDYDSCGDRSAPPLQRAARLLALNRQRWSGRLAAVLGTNTDTVRWRRGFPYWVPLSLNELYEYGRALFAEFPITQLQIVEESMQGHSRWTHSMITPGLSALPFLSCLTHLQIGPAFRRLFSGPTGNWDEHTLMTDLLASPVFASLVSLDLSGNRLRDADVVELVSRLPNAAFGETLRELDLSFCPGLGDAGAHALATAGSLEHFLRLGLAGLTLSAYSRSMLVRRFDDRVAF